MRIVILTLGSKGDVQPYLALGLGLKKAGHEVRLAATLPFREFVEEQGLEYVPLDADTGEQIEITEEEDWQETGRNFLLFTRRYRKHINKIQSPIKKHLEDTIAVCQGAEAIITSFTVPGGPHVAEKMKIPCYWALLQPMMNRNPLMPHFLSPPGLRLGKYYNIFTHIISEIIYWQIIGKCINNWRKEHLNLPPLTRKAFFNGIYNRKQPFLYGFSPNVIPKPPDWGDWLHITGYWFLDHPSTWQPPPGLVNFLESGPPPIYVNFDDIRADDDLRLLDLVLSALDHTGKRGILRLDWETQDIPDLPGNVFRVESVPFDWLFPQMEAVVHHGGAGTTAQAMRSGISSIIIYGFFDQTFWGRRAFELGVGPRPIFFKQVTLEKLIKAIEIAANDREMRARTVALSQRIRSEDGVARAVEAFHHHLPPS